MSAILPWARTASRARDRVTRLFNDADVRVGGHRPFDLHVHDERFYARVLAGGALALGESYMDGWWDAPELDAFLAHLLEARLDEVVVGWADVVDALAARLFNRQAGRRAFAVGEHHYDLGNDLYGAMLGARWI